MISYFLGFQRKVALSKDFGSAKNLPGFDLEVAFYAKDFIFSKKLYVNQS